MSAALTETEFVVIERACARLVLDSAECNDRRDFDGLAALFTEDATFSRPAGEPLCNRAAIVESYKARPANRITRHCCSNIRISVESAERARGTTYVVVYAADAEGQPDRHFGVPAEKRVLIGEFEDEFVRTQQGWRICARRAFFVMHHD